MGQEPRPQSGLRLLGGTSPGVAEMQEAILACLGARPEGLPPRALPVALAEHLGVAPAGVAPDRLLQTALGLLVAEGRVDEVGGRLVVVAGERRRAG